MKTEKIIYTCKCMPTLSITLPKEFYVTSNLFLTRISNGQGETSSANYQAAFEELPCFLTAELLEQIKLLIHFPDMAKIRDNIFLQTCKYLNKQAEVTDKELDRKISTLLKIIESPN